jgi:hypothetical protein
MEREEFCPIHPIKHFLANVSITLEKSRKSVSYPNTTYN